MRIWDGKSRIRDPEKHPESATLIPYLPAMLWVWIRSDSSIFDIKSQAL
jgi:hypothetical protein